MGLRKTRAHYRPYSNCVTLRGQLANWTSEDIVEVAKKNIEEIIEPIRDELGQETSWQEIEVENIAATTSANEPEMDGIFEFGSIGDSLGKKENEPVKNVF